MALRRRRVTSPAVAAAAATTAAHTDIPPERKRRRKGPMAVVAGILAALLISGFTVWNASMAAFSGYTDNTGNAWSSGKVNLVDNDAGAAMYTVTTPETPLSAPDQRCILVTYNGTVDANTPVKLYGDSTSVTMAAGDLSQYLNLTIEMGTDTSPAPFSCSHFTPSGAALYTGTVYDFETNQSGYAAGLSTAWTPHVNDVMSFRFTTSIQSVQGANGATLSGVPFKWETQSY